ncbi:alpha-(1-_3)-arabinofuranosyltransferase family protein [Janibacter sp. GXQ6167]|uniref:alpha-(1->3)-arabinofuranosyltransferase domain-containing protein n=1 Tax=Janibacter sp. GXQ6167 TaxID=3240791 RepID=UPI0035263A25
MTQAASPQASPAVWRLRLAAAVAMLAALCFHQAPGLIVPDTKLDLTADPAGFLGRALNLWDPQGQFGQLQNQAYGYLAPVGPFHWALSAIGLDAWVIQRLWWTVVLSVALIGMWRLLQHLGVASPWARFAAALAFALSPRLMSEVAVTSVEVWPLAMAPWVLIPLVDPAPRSWAWRISRSALAFALVGGINAVATGATLILPTIWFFTRKPWLAGVKWFPVWLGAVIAASAWWLGPLVVLGRYSPPFLDWIENAPITTAYASVFEGLRGTTPWLGFLAGPKGPSWPAQWLFVTEPGLIFVTAVLFVIALVGVLRLREEVRGFLVVGLLTGLILVTLGHTGALAGPFAGQLQALLDGPLAPLRNTHKFELVVRVVLTVGLAHAIDVAARGARRINLARWVVPSLTGALIVGLAAPGIAGALPRPEGYTEIPRYWHDAARYLDERPEDGTVLVIPGASFADFIWGSTKDEPLQALMNRPFAVRDAVPLGSAGGTRAMDYIERELRSGRGGPPLTNALRSAGIRFLVVRNDLRTDAENGAQLALHQSLARSRLTPVRTFGEAQFSLESPERTVDWRTRLPYPAVEVYDLGAVPSARQVPLDQVVSAPGAGAEDVADVRAAFPWVKAVVTGTDVSELGDQTSVPERIVVDGNKQREIGFGAIDSSSQVRADTDPVRSGRAIWDYIADPQAPQTHRVWDPPLTAVLASSSGSDANAGVRTGPGNGPQAAIDNDPSTAWMSGTFGGGVGQWLELRFDRPVPMDGLTIRLSGNAPVDALPNRVTVSTRNGKVTSALDPTPGKAQTVATPIGAADWVRVTIESMQPGRTDTVAGISELGLANVLLGSKLVVPATDVPPAAILLRETTVGQPQCPMVGDRPLCVTPLGRSPENEGGIRRTLTMPQDARYSMQGTVRAREGEGIEELLGGLTTIRAKASSRGVSAPAGRPEAAVDGSLGTGWVASPRELIPRLELLLPERIRTDGVQLQVDEFLAASRASRIRLIFDGKDAIEADVDEQGWAHFPKRSFRQVSIDFLQTRPLVSVDSVSGFEEGLPPGVSEVVFAGVKIPKPPATLSSPTGAACGFGPDLAINGQILKTRVRGTLADIVEGRDLTWSLCGQERPQFSEGTNHVVAGPSGEFVPTEIAFDHGEGEPDRSVQVAVERPSPTTLDLTLTSRQGRGESLLVIPQNFNIGWRAQTADGTELRPLRVDGWKQAWVVPAGTIGAIHASFAPNGTYQLALLIGGLLALFIVLGVILTSDAMGRRRPIPLHGRSVPVLRGRAVPQPLAVLLLVLLAGIPGAVGAAIAVLGSWLARRRSAVMIALIVVTGVLAAILAVRVTWPVEATGVKSWAVQFLALTAVAGASLGRWRRSAWRARRMSGRSKP